MRNDEPSPTAAIRPPLLLAIVVTTIVIALKAPQALTLPQFWAEDGTFFFAEQYGKVVPQLFTPCAGYLNLLSRLVAWLSTAVSNVHAPTIYNFAALGLSTAAVVSLRQLPFHPSVFWAVLAAIGLGLTNGEIFGTVTNAQWLMQFYLLVPVARFLGHAPSHRPILSCMAVLLTGLSGPFSIFAVAAAFAGTVWLWLESRLALSQEAIKLPRISAEIVVLAICGIAQLLVIFFGPPTHVPRSSLMPAWPAIQDILFSLQAHTLGTAWMPDALFCLLVVAAFILGLVRAEGPALRAVLVASAIFTATQLWTIAGKQQVLPADIHTLGIGDRYFVLFKVMLWIWLLLALRGLSRRYRELALPVVIACLGLIAVCNFGALQRPVFPDLNWKEHAKRMDNGEAVDVDIMPPPWKVSVPSK